MAHLPLSISNAEMHFHLYIITILLSLLTTALSVYGGDSENYYDGQRGKVLVKNLCPFTVRVGVLNRQKSLGPVQRLKNGGKTRLVGPDFDHEGGRTNIVMFASERGPVNADTLMASILWGGTDGSVHHALTVQGKSNSFAKYYVSLSGDAAACNPSRYGFGQNNGRISDASKEGMITCKLSSPAGHFLLKLCVPSYDHDW